jgi:hypothetical protein
MYAPVAEAHSCHSTPQDHETHRCVGSAENITLVKKVSAIALIVIGSLATIVGLALLPLCPTCTIVGVTVGVPSLLLGAALLSPATSWQFFESHRSPWRHDHWHFNRRPVVVVCPPRHHHHGHHFWG